MSFNNCLLTTNNPTQDAYEYLENAYKVLKATYICGQVEVGANGTRHI